MLLDLIIDLIFLGICVAALVTIFQTLGGFGVVVVILISLAILGIIYLFR
jgi:hypothetical protein